MICEERTETKHAQRASAISMFRHTLTISHSDELTTPHNAAEWMRDQQLSLRIWQARSLWQTYDPIGAGYLLPK